MVFSAGAAHETALTSPVAGSVRLYAATPPVAFMPPWHPAQLKALMLLPVGANSSAPHSTNCSSLRLDGAGLAVGLEHPVDRQRDDGDRQQQHAEAEHAVEALALQHVVVVVRLAVRCELDLRAELVARLAEVEEQVDEPADEDDREENHAIEVVNAISRAYAPMMPRGLRGRERSDGHQCLTAPTQCGPSASWPVVLVPIGMPRMI